ICRAGGGGRRHRTLNLLEHTIDVREHIVVPVAQDSITVRLKHSCAFRVGGRCHAMLTAIDLHDDSFRVACEIDDVASDLNLPPEMGACCSESVTQMPPQLPFRLRWHGTHLAGK